MGINIFSMQRKDIILLWILFAVALLIFHPLFYTDYLFMDEALQIWGYKSDPDFYMLIDEGRWLTEVLEGWLFRTFVNTIHDINWLRVISLTGWLACLPVWYMIIKRQVAKAPGYDYLPFFTCLYLVTSLPFAVSVQWATCLQFFIADTASLVAGVIILNSLRTNGDKFRIPVVATITALLLGLLALFLYQGAFACFLIPFLVYFINPYTTKKDTILLTGLVYYFFVCGVYFVTYKLSFSLLNVPADPRNSLFFDPIGKLKWFLARPLERSFRFTLLTHEESTISKVFYPMMLTAWVVLAFMRFGKAKRLDALKYLAGTGFIFLISYLPALLIQESFASNRTLLALNICVFVVMLEMALFFINNMILLRISGIAIAIVFVVSARYNFQTAFMKPVHEETVALKNYFQQHYHSNIKTVLFIRPSEEFMSQKYQVPKSMDEFGVASSCWEWVPDPLVRQMVYEATGNRELAKQVIVKHWPNVQSFQRSGETVNDNTLLVNVEAIMH